MWRYTGDELPSQPRVEGEDEERRQRMFPEGSNTYTELVREVGKGISQARWKGVVLAGGMAM